MYNQNKGMLKVKSLIKNTPSMLHHIRQRRGVLKTPSNIEGGDLCRRSKEHSVLTVFEKTSIPVVWLVLNTCYKMVVRKFPIYNLK